MYYPPMISPTSRIPLTRLKLGVVIIGGVAALMLLSSFPVRAAEPSGGIRGATDSEAPKQKYQLQAADPDAPRIPARGSGEAGGARS